MIYVNVVLQDKKKLQAQMIIYKNFVENQMWAKRFNAFVTINIKLHIICFAYMRFSVHNLY